MEVVVAEKVVAEWVVVEDVAVDDGEIPGVGMQRPAHVASAQRANGFGVSPTGFFS